MRRFALFWFGLVVAILVALGLIVLFSASQGGASGLSSESYHFAKNQITFAVFGSLIAAVLAALDYRHLREHPWLVWIAFAVVLGLLVSVFAYPMTKGSNRWIPLAGGFRLQPAELAKLMTVFTLALLLDRAGWRVELFLKGALFPSFFVGLIALPIALEPDYGSTMVILVLTATLLFVAGVRIVHLIPLGLIAMGLLAILVMTNPNRMARIRAFVQIAPSAEHADDSKEEKARKQAAKEADYQSRQALIAIKNGGLRGAGLGMSMQKHAFLPEAHTDFILAIGAEELGLGFSLAVVILFCMFFALCVYIAKTAVDRFGALLVIGMGVLIFFQAMFNIGVVCKAFPTKGMALPFFSYGGTNMLTSFIAVGTILSVGIHSFRHDKRQVGIKIARKVLQRV